MSWAAGEDRVTNQPAVPRQLQADAARCMTRQVMYAHTAAAKAHILAIVQLRIGSHGQQIGVGRVNSDGGARGLAHFRQSAGMIGVAVREQDGDQARASDGTQQCTWVIAWVYEQCIPCAAEEDITIGLVRTYRNTQDIHVHRVGAWLLLGNTFS
jgi:hypothetical protein